MKIVTPEEMVCLDSTSSSSSKSGHVDPICMSQAIPSLATSGQHTTHRATRVVLVSDPSSAAQQVMVNYHASVWSETHHLTPDSVLQSLFLGEHL